MAPPRHNQASAPTGTRIDLAEKGWMAVVAGLFLLVVMPGFAQGQMARWIRPTMRSVGGVALVLGIALLCMALVQARKRKSAAADEQASVRGSSAMDFAQDASVSTPAASTSARAPDRDVAAANETASTSSAGAASAQSIADDAPGWSDTELVQPVCADTEFTSPAWADTQVLDHDSNPHKKNPASAPVTAAAPVILAPESSLWSAAVLAGVDQQGFTAVVRAMFAQAGFTSEIRPGDPAVGVDLSLRSRENPIARITRCKHMDRKPVGENALREFWESIGAQHASNCTVITNSVFTAEAVRFARGNSIALLDGSALLRQIAKRTPEQQTALLSLAGDQLAGGARGSSAA